MGGHPVVAANFPAPLRRRVSTDGLDALTPEERATTPVELLANTPEYWRRVDNAIRGHAGMMGPTPAVDDPRLTSVQSLWDNSMGEACALALERNPRSSVLHVNGGFHTEYWDGTARQLRLRAPKARIATVAIVTSANPHVAEPFGAPVADFVVYVEERAQDVSSGEYAVFVPRKLEYRLHVPTSANDTAPAPLLVWFADDGESTADVFALWKARVGEEAAVLVLEPPYREIQDDLVPGGRWFWPDSFSEDMSALREAVARALEFVALHQPVDVARTCIAGEGRGATVAAVIGLFDERGSERVLAYEPRHFRKIADFPLPLPELRGDEPEPNRTLRIVPRADDEAWWENEVTQYRAVGLAAQLARAPTDPWSAESSRENGVRTALDLAPRAVADDAKRAHVRVDGPRARSWARLAPQSRADDSLVALIGSSEPEPTDSVEVMLTVRAADFTEPRHVARLSRRVRGNDDRRVARRTRASGSRRVARTRSSASEGRTPSPRRRRCDGRSLARERSRRARRREAHECPDRARGLVRGRRGDARMEELHERVRGSHDAELATGARRARIEDDRSALIELAQARDRQDAVSGGFAHEFLRVCRFASLGESAARCSCPVLGSGLNRGETTRNVVSRSLLAPRADPSRVASVATEHLPSPPALPTRRPCPPAGLPPSGPAELATRLSPACNARHCPTHSFLVPRRPRPRRAARACAGF